MTEAGIDSNVFLHGASRFLFFLHAAAGAGLAGLSVHCLVSATRKLVEGSDVPGPITARFVRYAFFLNVSVLVLGFLTYPEYKANIRVAFIDINAPAVGKVFDIKEYLAVFSLPLAAFLYSVPGRKGKVVHGVSGLMYTVCMYMWAAMVWATAVIGWYTSSVRSLGVP